MRSVDAKGKETLYNLESLINQAVFPGLQGGPHNHAIAGVLLFLSLIFFLKAAASPSLALWFTGVAVALKQAMTPEFKVYQQQVLANCKALSNALVGHGYKIVTGKNPNYVDIPLWDVF